MSVSEEQRVHMQHQGEEDLKPTQAVFFTGSRKRGWPQSG